MTSNTIYCLLYHGMPIEGFSSSNGYPIFVSHDRFIPDFHFLSYETASFALNNMMVDLIDMNHTFLIDANALSIGTIETKIETISTPSVYDNLFEDVLTDSCSVAKRNYTIGKIITLCVRGGFRTVLPRNYTKILEDSEFSELFDKNVPFFVQQNIDRFIDAGISTCNEEEIAAIILTSSDELLKAIRIDSLNNVSK